MPSLDPRRPLVLDTQELGRRPGTERSLSATAPAPPDLGIEMLKVPEGDDIALDLRLEAVMEGVLVSGEVSTHVHGECVRCLDPIDEAVDVDLQELFLYDDADDQVGDDEDEDTRRMDGDLIDLEPLLRDAIVLALPTNPVCDDDCPGLCTVCGAHLADDPDHTHDAPVDPRLASLASLLGDSDVADRMAAVVADDGDDDGGAR